MPLLQHVRMPSHVTHLSREVQASFAVTTVHSEIRFDASPSPATSQQHADGPTHS